MTSLQSLSFSGELLQRGFWLYVWEVTAADGRTVHYVGRTGDSSSPNAQSPFTRLSQHLGTNVHANALSRHLMNAGIDPKTPADLEALEQMLVQAGVGTAEEIEKVAQQEHGLGLFVRSLVGLDRAAAKRAFSKFLEDRQLNAQQLDFVNLIVDHLTQCGWMRPEQLYLSPFTDEFSAGPNTIFTEEAAMQALISTLSAIRLNAAGA